MMARFRYSFCSLAIAGFAALAFTAAPVGLGFDFSPELESAFAKGKGSGKSGGKGGGKSAGKSGGQANKDSGGKFGDDRIKAGGKANGHAKKQRDDNAAGTEKGEKLKKNGLGNLNAAHASPNAREHASPNSMVGLIAAYAAEAGDMTTDEAREALGAISNKASFDEGLGVDAVDQEVVAEVNALLGIDNSDDGQDPAQQ
jgi:hypothetical protein